MNPRLLQAFVRVAEHGSLARAAMATHQADSLISRRISALETLWGARLFDRTGRGMALSQFGQRMLPETRAALDQMERLTILARESAGVPSGTVRLGVLPSIVPTLLPVLFEDLLRSAPGVSLQAAEGFSGDLDEQLAGGRLDLALINRYGTSVGRLEELLGRTETWLVGKPGGPFPAGGDVGFRQLSGIPLVLPSPPNGLRATLDQLARRHAVRLNIVMEVDSAGAMKDVARTGLAWTLLPLMAVKADVAQGRLSAVRLVKPRIVRTIVMSASTHRPLSHAGRHVAQRLRALAPALIG